MVDDVEHFLFSATYINPPPFICYLANHFIKLEKINLKTCRHIEVVNYELLTFFVYTTYMNSSPFVYYLVNHFIKFEKNKSRDMYI